MVMAFFDPARGARLLCLIGVLALLAVAGCGGGGAVLEPPPDDGDDGVVDDGDDGGGDGAPVTPEPPAPGAWQVTAFADGAGLFRVVEGGQRSVVLTSDAAGFGAGEAGVLLDRRTLRVIGRGRGHVTYQAEFTDAAGRRGVAVLHRRDPDGGIGDCGIGCGAVSLAHLRVPGEGRWRMETAGPAATRLPRGSHSYRGLHLVGFTGDSGLQEGTFTMSVDFARGRAEFDARSPDFEIRAADIAIDRGTGAFSSGALQIVGLEGGPTGGPTGGTIRGSLHGRGATGVSGIWHQNAAAPEVFGGFAGTR